VDLNLRSTVYIAVIGMTSTRNKLSQLHTSLDRAVLHPGYNYGVNFVCSRVYLQLL